MNAQLRKGRDLPRERYFVPVPRGLEPVLLAEMEALGLPEVNGIEAGAFFAGTLEDCYRANLWLRTGARVLRVVAEFECRDEKSLYREARKVDWFRWLDPDQTFAVRARIGRSVFRHSMYLARLIKDGIVDEFREGFGRRPNVDKTAPHLQVHVWFDQDRCTLSLDSSGGPLFKRGYRQETGEAPLRENLAAGLIGLTGWRADRPFRDILCGSGTLPIEAALIATQRAPGLTRERFGFQHWKDFQGALWKRVRAEAEAAVRPCPVEIRGSDLDPAAIEQARRNAAAAGVAEAIRFDVADFRDTGWDAGPGEDRGEAPVSREADFRDTGWDAGPGEDRGEAPAAREAERGADAGADAPAAGSGAPPSGPRGVLLVNPPYGERLGRGSPLPLLYKGLGDTLKRRYKGWEAYVFAEHGELLKAIGLRASRRTILFNGALECRLLQFKLY